MAGSVSVREMLLRSNNYISLPVFVNGRGVVYLDRAAAVSVLALRGPLRGHGMTAQAVSVTHPGPRQLGPLSLGLPLRSPLSLGRGPLSLGLPLRSGRPDSAKPHPLGPPSACLGASWAVWTGRKAPSGLSAA